MSVFNTITMTDDDHVGGRTATGRSTKAAKSADWLLDTRHRIPQNHRSPIRIGSIRVFAETIPSHSYG